MCSGEVASGPEREGPIMRVRHHHQDRPGVAPAGAQPESLLDVIERAHRAVRHGLGLPPERLSAAHPVPRMDGRDAEDAYDAEVATLSEHLGAVEAVVHPVARRRLAQGHAAVTAQRRRARHLEQLMRLIEGRWHGDTYAMDMDVEQLQSELAGQVETYAEAELELARDLDAALSSAQRGQLVTHLAVAMKHAPTRPHPYLAHPRGLAGPMMRVFSAWDRALDVMDNRKVPGPPPPRRTKPLSLWDRYFLGSAGFEEQPSAPPATLPPTGPAAQ